MDRHNDPTSSHAGHLDCLDGLRGIAALFVLLHHALLEAWSLGPELQAPQDLPACLAWLLYGHFGVGVFIVLSGFCLMWPVVRCGGKLSRGTLDFWKRRARRILPPYYLSVVVSLLLIWTLIGAKTGTHWDTSIPVTATGLTDALTLQQDVHCDGQINHVYWSIAVECKIYLLFPLIVLFWRRAGGPGTALALLVVGLLGYAQVRGTLLEVTCPQFLGLFGLGMLAAEIAFSEASICRKLRQLFPWPAAAAGFAGALAACCQRWGWEAALHSFGYLDILVGLATLCLLVAATGTGPGRIQRVLAARPLVLLGAFAYSIYLIHAPLLQVVWQYAVQPLALRPLPSFVLLVAGGGPAIVAGAYCFFWFCEKPFLNSGAVRPGENAVRRAGDTGTDMAPASSRRAGLRGALASQDGPRRAA